MKPGKVLIIGSNGQLGSDLMRVFADQDVTGVTHAEFDITDPKQVESIVSAKPSVVVNTAAYHRTEGCEENPETAFRVNTLGPLDLARACETAGSLLIHISTDYVFDGAQKSPYVEADRVNPLNVYGISKVAGELAVSAYCSRHYIVRTSGLYGSVPCRAKGENFVAKMLRIATEKDAVTVVTDEVLTPTWTYALAQQIECLCSSNAVPFGLIHATAEGECSWYEFAQEIFSAAEVKVRLLPASVKSFPAKVARPHYSVLENKVLKEAGASVLPHWRESLREYLKSHRSASRPQVA